MPKVKDFSQVFQDLKAIIEPFEKELVLKTNESDNYYLDTHHKRKDGYVEAFGGVQVKKNYVSYHLMPVYAYPELLASPLPRTQKTYAGQIMF